MATKKMTIKEKKEAKEKLRKNLAAKGLRLPKGYEVTIRKKPLKKSK
jgi:hypothetical protein